MFDFLVVGAGLFGAAAARALSQAGGRVGIVGPAEPTDPAAHEGIFASHYDQARLAHRLSDDPLWGALAARSLEHYPALQVTSGIPFLDSCGALAVGPDPPARAGSADLPLTPYADGAAIRAAHPLLDFPDTVHGVLEGPPAGTVNPRALVRAQLAVAQAHGATRERAVVVALKDGPLGVEATTDRGQTLRAGRVLVAGGPFTNAHALLPRPLALRVKSETILLASLADDEAERLAPLPTVRYAIAHATVQQIYLTPPRRTPDGTIAIKLGANTRGDRGLIDLAAMQAWMRCGTNPTGEQALREVLEQMIPTLTIDRVRGGRCLVTYTAHGHPYVDQVGAHTFVAVGGNGRGAKGSDATGALAASMMLEEGWPAPFRRADFRAIFDGSRS